MSNHISRRWYQRNFDSFWLSSDAVHCLLKSRLVGSPTYPLPDVFVNSAYQTPFKMKPTFFFIVIIIFESWRNLFDSFSQSFPDFEELDQHDEMKIPMDFPFIVKSTAGFLSDALRKRTNSLQTGVSWRNWYTLPAVQALWRRSDRGGCLLWLAVPAVVLVTTGGVTGERGLAVVVASPARPPN